MREVATVIADALTPVCTAARVSPEILAADVMLALHRKGYAVVQRKAMPPVVVADHEVAALGRLIQLAHERWVAMGAPGADE